MGLLTGIIHPNRVIVKGSARRRPAGAHQGAGGVVTTLNGKASEAHVMPPYMSWLNRLASQLARDMTVHAMTDITGYGLLGHAHEMAHLGLVDFEIQHSQLAWLPGAQAYAHEDLFPGGMYRNQEFFESWVRFDDDLNEIQRQLLFDPETSGGLLMAVASDQAEALCTALVKAGETAHIIGQVLPGNGKLRVIV
jgi:selenide,water dikinase